LKSINSGSNLQSSTAFLQPFSDFIHQIEADRRALGRCYEGLMTLANHIRQSMEAWSLVFRVQCFHEYVGTTPELHGWCTGFTATSSCSSIFDWSSVRCCDATKDSDLPIVSNEHKEMEKEFIGTVGGEIAVQECKCMSFRGWDGYLADGARICATPPSDAHDHGVGNNGHDLVAAVGMRQGLWKRYGMARYPALAKVALRLWSIQPTSAATERKWSFWGRAYTAARNTLGLERARALIMFCFNDRCQVTDQQDFKLPLPIVER
jgi:hypothetical protein